MDSQQLWQATLGQLQVQLPRPTFDTWIKNTHGISYEDGVLVVGVHSAYAKDWLENRLYAKVQRTATEIAGRTTDIRFVVQRNGVSKPEDFGLLEMQAPSQQETPSALSERERSRVVPKYTFSSFIVGQSNRLAHAGCLAVSENPGLAYNPLFIYGGVGLGKTHLQHAIGNRVLQDHKRTLYVSAETFANELINTIRNHNTDDFRAKYRTIDVLLIDDVQFLINKERTQEEFFHTFNDLYQDSKQIVLSSDRSPKAFVGLEERLRSRFEWGLIVDIQPPDLEMRIAILSAKLEARGMHVPNEVLEFIAQRVQSNIRELEGALNRVLVLARTMGYPFTVQTAEIALGNTLRSQPKVTCEDILATVAAYHGLRVDDLTGPRRPRNIATARQVAMYLARELIGMSFPQIGQALGGRDHTTAMYGHDKIAALFEKDDEMRHQVLEIKTSLYGKGWQVLKAQEKRRA